MEKSLRFLWMVSGESVGEVWFQFLRSGKEGKLIARKLDNWLKTFLQWALPRSEAPESYHLFAGLFALSAALRRNVHISREYLGGWECYPHLFIMFVGPPGAVRKTTTMKFAGDLLDEIKFLTPAPTIVTQAALLKRLVDAKDASVYIFSKEFSDLVMKSEGEMYEFLTSMFDGDAKYESETISRGIEFAKNPCVNLFAATTPEWISNSMPEAVIGGGFASRCIFVYEDTPRFKKLYYKGSFDPKQMLETRQDLIDDLKHIGTALQGPYAMNQETQDFMEDWYQKMKVPQGTKIASYYARKPTHVHKLAMLLHASRSDTMTLDIQDFKEAIYILDSIEPRMLEVFGGVGKNPYTVDIKSIWEFITSRGEVSKEEVLITFESSAPPLMLEQLIDALLKTKRIKLIVKDGGRIFYGVN